MKKWLKQERKNSLEKTMQVWCISFDRFCNLCTPSALNVIHPSKEINYLLLLAIIIWWETSDWLKSQNNHWSSVVSLRVKWVCHDSAGLHWLFSKRALQVEGRLKKSFCQPSLKVMCFFSLDVSSNRMRRHSFFLVAVFQCKSAGTLKRCKCFRRFDL